jgi:hypothetical protein
VRVRPSRGHLLGSSHLLAELLPLLRTHRVAQPQQDLVLERDVLASAQDELLDQVVELLAVGIGLAQGREGVLALLLLLQRLVGAGIAVVEDAAHRRPEVLLLDGLVPGQRHRDHVHDRSPALDLRLGATLFVAGNRRQLLEQRRHLVVVPGEHVEHVVVVVRVLDVAGCGVAGRRRLEHLRVAVRPLLDPVEDVLLLGRVLRLRRVGEVLGAPVEKARSIAVLGPQGVAAVRGQPGGDQVGEPGVDAEPASDLVVGHPCADEAQHLAACRHPPTLRFGPCGLLPPAIIEQTSVSEPAGPAPAPCPVPGRGGRRRGSPAC